MYVCRLVPCFNIREYRQATAMDNWCIRIESTVQQLVKSDIATTYSQAFANEPSQ